jgi:thiamine-monophosphate kinase
LEIPVIEASRGAPEFDLIDRIRSRVGTRGDVVLGIGDDAALLQLPAGRQLVVAMDTLNAGVHFPLDTAPADIGWKALAVNLSDLAAMGAQPAWCTLSLSLPSSDATWIDGFLDGFLALASRHDVALVGGDTTRGPLSVCVTVHGLVEPGRALRRDGARVGDDVWVSGTLGDAAGALRLLLPFLREEGRGEGPPGGGDMPAAEPPLRPLSPRERGLVALRPRLDRPVPRVELGIVLSTLAHACIDISDGLLADLGHVARASGVAVDVRLDALPASPALRSAFEYDQRIELQATGGDDYELCFTAAPDRRACILALADTLRLPLTRIGRVVAGEGVHAAAADGRRWQPSRAGYEHFG